MVSIRQTQYSMNGVCSFSFPSTLEYRVTLSFYGELNQTPQTFSFSFLSLPSVNGGTGSPYYSYTITGDCNILSFAGRNISLPSSTDSNLTYVINTIRVIPKNTDSLAFLECPPSTPVNTALDVHDVNCTSSIITQLPSLIGVTSTLRISFCCF